MAAKHLSFLIVIVSALTGSAQQLAGKPDFAHDIVPILKTKCAECHTNGIYKGGVSFDTREEGKEILLLSERDGWRQAHGNSRDGKERWLLTKDKSNIITRGPVDEQTGWFYYLASPNNATQRYLYRIRLDGKGDPERVTPMDQPGTHTYEFSPDRTWAFHTYSTFDKPPVVDLVRLSDHHSLRANSRSAT